MPTHTKQEPNHAKAFQGEQKEVRQKVQQRELARAQEKPHAQTRRIPTLTCYHPMPAAQLAKGEKVILWPSPAKITDQHGEFNLPCGKCIGCKTDRATAWAIRCNHEAQQFENNRFLTMTYDEQYLPDPPWLNVRACQLFMKRLRKSRPNDIIRFFLTGQYGDITQRPHYHALLFNVRFPDEKKASKHLLQSDEADKIWGLGAVRIGMITAASASYVAQYSLRETQSAVPADADGTPAPKQFALMSRGGRGPKNLGGIGSTWLEKFHQDLQNNQTILEGQKKPIPRGYLKRLKEGEPLTHADIEYLRSLPGKRQDPKERLDAAEKIHWARRNQSLRRKL